MSHDHSQNHYGSSHDRIYAFRRKGQFDFCTCSEYRYHECAAMPELFEMAIFFTEQQVAAKDAEIARLQSAYDFATVLVAKLHVAAMGEVVGPVLGVVEDVANVREQMLEAQEQLAAKDVEIARLESTYNSVAWLVAKMHEAAMGEVIGPVLGVVEDVANVRKQLVEAQNQLALRTHQIIHEDAAIIQCLDRARAAVKS